MPIKKLDENVIVRIAAGEVIERPASVVKELVENAIDAGSTKITVKIEDGGLGLIEVSDNGSGIQSDELGLAIQRHATSKLTNANDLTNIHTLGFRGEALATIAAVSRLTIISKTEGQDGVMLKRTESMAAIDDGKTGAADLGLEPAAREKGTTIIVRDLFCWTPARLKFMKSSGSEFSKLSDLLDRIALAHSGISFELIKDGKRIFQTSGRSNMREVIGELYGTELARDMIEIETEYGPLKLSGFISPTHITRRNRTRIKLSLWGRPFEDKSVMHAVTSAYHGVIPHGNFPVAFLNLEVPHRDIDVNVHPAKAEVRFRDGQSVHKLVSRGLRAKLQGDVRLPTLGLESQQASASFTSDRVMQNAASQSANAELFSAPAVDQETTSATTPNEEISRAVSQLEKSSDVSSQAHDLQAAFDVEARSIRLHYSGEIAGRYVLAEDNEGLVIIDQHAAHERVLFDELMKQAQNGEVVESPLMVPVIIEASASERALIEERKDFFREIGFEVEIWPDSIALQSVPAVISQADAARVIREVIDNIKESGVTEVSRIPYERLAMQACKAAVKGTQRLEPDEANQLLKDLTTTTDPYNCPHGRPTMIRLSLSELDKRFGRT